MGGLQRSVSIKKKILPTTLTNTLTFKGAFQEILQQQVKKTNKQT